MNYQTFLAILIGGPAISLILLFYRVLSRPDLRRPSWIAVCIPTAAMITFFAVLYISLILGNRLWDLLPC